MTGERPTLINGQVFVPYSDHYKIVINPQTVTVFLTPQSTDTYGLVVVSKNETGFLVKEAKNGTGNFSFDWEVSGVRKGYENFEVVRSNDSVIPAIPNDNLNTGN
jgi:hypothetical protein